MDIRDLAGTDERAPIRRKAWEALGKWVNSRVSRQRGVHVPNLFQVAFKLVATDGSGSKLRRPIFVLSERFADNFGVRQAGSVDRNIPPPGSGDDVNFYQLAIQHSEGLSKDQAFSSIRDVLFRLGEVAGQGREVRLDLGCGTLLMHDREVTFEFTGGMGGGAASSAASDVAEKVSHLDPMLNGRLAGGSGGGGLAMQGAAVEAQPHSPPRSMLSALQQPRAGSELGGQRLSAEEEAALFADVDALDPESRVEVASSLMRAAELEAPTRTQVSKALALDDKSVGDKSVEEINAALGARAAALEAQLRAQRAETDQIEAKLREAGAPPPPPTKVPYSSKQSRVPPLSHAPRQPAPQAGGLHELGSGLLSVSGGGGSGLGRGSRCSGGAPRRAAIPTGRQAEGGGAGGAPMLSVGFSNEGPGQLGALPPPPPRGAQAKPPVVSAVLSDCNSSGLPSALRGGVPNKRTSGKVPTAPPLGPFRYAMPQPNDAANVAWKRHSAPQVKGSAAAGGSYGRPVGGLAPPFLAAPPSLAAAMMAKAQGGR